MYIKVNNSGYILYSSLGSGSGSGSTSGSDLFINDTNNYDYNYNYGCFEGCDNKKNGVLLNIFIFFVVLLLLYLLSFIYIYIKMCILYFKTVNCSYYNCFKNNNSKNKIHPLPIQRNYIYTNEMDDITEIGDCTICLTPNNNFSIQFHCKHIFHIDCIQQWDFVSNQNGNNTHCPLCRSII